MLLRHFHDLAEQSQQRYCYTFTNFLNPAEQAMLLSAGRELTGAGLQLYGQEYGCERSMAAFGSEKELGYPPDYPVAIMQIRPAAEKFAEELNHRDYLGALMNLGIDRDQTGDIRVSGKTAWVFCTEKILPYIMEHLTQVRHTAVTCTRSEQLPAEAQPRFEEKQITAASCRADAAAAALTGLSRSKAQELFRRKLVMIGGREAEDPSVLLRPADVLSIRGCGKFIFDGQAGETRSGRSRLIFRKYV